MEIRVGGLIEVKFAAAEWQKIKRFPKPLAAKRIFNFQRKDNLVFWLELTWEYS